jgi:hypothetical protein
MMCATPVLNLRFVSGIVHPLARSKVLEAGPSKNQESSTLFSPTLRTPAQDGAPTSWKSPANTMDVL